MNGNKDGDVPEAGMAVVMVVGLLVMMIVMMTAELPRTMMRTMATPMASVVLITMMVISGFQTLTPKAKTLNLNPQRP